VREEVLSGPLEALDAGEADLACGELKPLPLRHGGTYHTHLYLAWGQEQPGPATRLLADFLRAAVKAGAH